MPFPDQRRATIRCVGHEHVHLIGQEGVGPVSRRGVRRRAVVVAPAKDLEVLGGVLFDGQQVRCNVLVVSVGLPQVFEQRLDDTARDVDVERVQLVTGLALPPAQRPHRVRQGIVQHAARLLDGAALGFRQLPQRVRRERLAVANRGHAETYRRLDKRMSRRAGLTVKSLQRRLPLALFPLANVAPLRLVLVGGEGPRHLAFERRHQIGYVPTKLGRRAGRQAQRSGAVRLVEVVDVAPIRRGGTAVRHGAESLENH